MISDSKNRNTLPVKGSLMGPPLPSCGTPSSLPCPGIYLPPPENIC